MPISTTDVVHHRAIFCINYLTASIEVALSSFLTLNIFRRIYKGGTKPLVHHSLNKFFQLAQLK